MKIYEQIEEKLYENIYQKSGTKEQEEWDEWEEWGEWDVMKGWNEI